MNEKLFHLKIMIHAFAINSAGFLQIGLHGRLPHEDDPKSTAGTNCSCWIADL